jgi:lipocalin
MAKILLTLVVVSLSLVNGMWAQVCATTPTIANFDAPRYLGKWYEIEKFETTFQQNLKCVTAQYGSLNSTHLSVLNYGFNPNTNQASTISGSAYGLNPNEPNKLIVVLRIELGNGIFIDSQGKYEVWDTDYTSYALVYSCTGATVDTRQETSWILARSKTLDASVIANLKAKLSASNVDVSKFKATVQDCDN